MHVCLNMYCMYIFFTWGEKEAERLQSARVLRKVVPQCLCNNRVIVAVGTRGVSGVTHRHCVTHHWLIDLLLTDQHSTEWLGNKSPCHLQTPTTQLTPLAALPKWVTNACVPESGPVVSLLFGCGVRVSLGNTFTVTHSTCRMLVRRLLHVQAVLEERMGEEKGLCWNEHG